MLPLIPSGPESAFLLAAAKAGGIAGMCFVMFFISMKVWVRVQKQDSDRIDVLVKMADERWNQKFIEDARERERQYGLFKGLLDNVSAHTGELASINAKLDSQSRDINDINRGMGVLHGRIDKALDNRSYNGVQSGSQHARQQERA